MTRVTNHTREGCDCPADRRAEVARAVRQHGLISVARYTACPVIGCQAAMDAAREDAGKGQSA